MSEVQPHETAFPNDAQTADPNRASRLVEFYATLSVLTPRVFVTPMIVITCVGLFALMVVNDPRSITAPTIDTLLFWGANNGPLSLNGQPWRLFTCMFLHIGIMHLAINMWILWDIGRLMERVAGNVGFTLLYVTSGLCGSLASIVWNPQVVGAGASGAVFGLFGGLLGFLMLGRGSMPTEVSSRFRSSAMTFVGYNLFFGLIIPQVDNAAHIGGLVGGFLCGLCLGQPLTLDASDYRWWRNLLVLVLGAGMTSAGLLLIPTPADVGGALRAFTKVETDVIAQYNDLVRQTQAGKMTAAGFADGIQNQVLPPWRELRQRLEGLKKVPDKVRPFVDALVKYTVLREETWDLQVLANRDPTPERLTKFHEREGQLAAALAEVERIGGETNKGGK